MIRCADIMKAYARLGIATIPTQGKFPFLPAWNTLPVPTEDTINGWLKDYRTFNVGVLLGPTSRLICIDIDPRNGGLEWYEENSFLMADGVHEITGRGDGGRHIYYRTRGNIDWGKKTIAEGVDFLGTGQAITYPSVHPETGNMYYFDGKSLEEYGDDIPCIEDNEPLIELCRDAIRKPRSKSNQPAVYRDTLNPHDHKKLLRDLENLDAGKGRHHQIGYWICNAVIAGMDHNEVEDLANDWLYEAGRDINEQPDEVKNWIETAMKKIEMGEYFISADLCTDELLDDTAEGTPQLHIPSTPIDEVFEQEKTTSLASPIKQGNHIVSDYLTGTHLVSQDTDNFYVGQRVFSRAQVDKVGVTALMGRHTVDRDLVPSIHTDERGRVRDTSYNISLLLQTQEGLKNTLRYDEFASRYMIMGRPTWIQKGRMHADGVPFTDAHEAVLKMYLEALIGGRSISSQNVKAAIRAQAIMNSYDPLKEYIKGLQWDGVPRVNRLCKDYLKCVEDPDSYLEMVSRVWMLSAVGRAMYAGCKVDTVPVLTSSQQGLGKSTAVNILGGRYAGEMTGDLHAKDTAIGLQGKWFIEVSEMDALSRNEMTLVKAFLTRMSDDYRAPYGTVSEEHPRRTIFVGTSNNRTPLTDATGNRRFLMLTVGSFIDREALIRDRDQLFAEAWYRLQKGEKWELDSREYEMAVAAQADRLSVDHIMSLVVRSALGLWIQKKSFDLHDILMTVFKLTTGADATPLQALRVKKCLHAVGFLESRGRWILGVVDSNKRAIALAAGVDMAKILKEAGHAPLFDGPNQRTDDLVEDSSEGSDTAKEEPLDFY